MRKVIVSQFLTLDGVAQAPGGPDEDTDSGFAYGGWQVPYFGEDDSDTMSYVFDNMGAMLLGRKTYDIFADYWPHAGDGEQELIGDNDASIATLMNGVPIYVASHADTLKSWDNGDVTHLGDDLATEINALKQQDGKDIIVWGSGDLVQSLIRENLIDEYFLMIHPLVLGTGKKLFGDDIPKQDLELTSSKTSKSGVLVLTYSVKK
ncbi:MAG: deaminase-reductase protein [Candidatus Saccharibacteria bacterium]|nr:deaminase-reductase protein [Candidatus Saccharibacteria bacterium]